MRLCLASAIAIALFASSVRADPRPMLDAAKLELDRGLQRFADHDYAGAITAFDTGYAIDPHPDFLYAKAQAQRLGGDCRGAIASYTAFLESSPPQTEAELARTNVTRCERQLKLRQDVVAAAHATDGSPDPDPTPVATPAPDRPETPPPPEPPWYRDSVGLGLAGTGMIALGAAVGFMVSAKASADETATVANLADWTSSRDAWSRDRIVAGVATGVGVALIAGAAIRFWYAKGAHVTAGVAAIGHGAAMTVEGRW